MEHNKPSANKLRDKLNSLPTNNWDTDALWKDFEQQLPQSKRRGILWLFLFFGAGLSLLLYVFALSQPAAFLKSTQTQTPQFFLEAPKHPAKPNSPITTQIPKIEVSDLKKDRLVFSPTFAKKETNNRIKKVTPPLSIQHYRTQVRSLEHSPSIVKLRFNPIPTKYSPVVASTKPSSHESIPPIPPHSQVYSYWTLNLRSSAYLPISSFGPIVNESLNPAGRNRKNTETALEILETQFTASYHLSARWQISSGLRLSRWTTRVDWSSTNLYTTRVQSDQAFFYVANDGNRQYFSGNVPTQKTEKRVIQHYNTLERIDLPVRVTYQRQTNAWGWYIEGGLAINLGRQITGRYIDGQNTPQSMESFDGFRNHLGISLLGGFGVSYAWHPDWKLNVGLQMEYRPTSLVDPNNVGYQQHLHQIGLGIGVSRKL